MVSPSLLHPVPLSALLLPVFLWEVRREGGREGLVVFRLALLDYSSVHLADTSEMA